MSWWTHVAGIIRFDHFIFDEDEQLTNDDFDNIIGKEVLWHSDQSVWDDAEKNPDKYLPYGSEGSLQKNVYINPDTSHVPAYVVSIWGDLRDFNDPGRIIEWFEDKCKWIDHYLDIGIRQATITAENGIKTLNYTYGYGVKEE